MRSDRLIRSGLVVLLSVLTGVNASCGDIVVRSVKSGLFSFVSGGLTYTLGGGQLSNFANNIFNGNNNTSTTTGSGT